MFRAIIITLFCFFSNQVFSLDTKVVKEHVINYCAKEPSRELKLSCLLSATKSYENFIIAADSEYGTRTIALCFSKVDKSSTDGLHYLVKCVDEHTTLYKSHPFPYFSESIFFVSKMRSEWAAFCLSQGTKKITKCMSGKEIEFKETWSFYMKISDFEYDHPIVKKFIKCLGGNFVTANYLKSNVCLK